MFQQTYQGGQYVEIINMKDAKNCKDNNEKKKFIQNLITFSQTTDYHFDQYLKSFVLKMSNKSSMISMPSQSNSNLSLVQPFLVLQIKLPESNPWSIILILNDTNNTRRRVNFSNSISSIEQKYFSLQVPTKFVQTGQWMNLSIDMPSFMAMFPGQTFRSLEGIIVNSQCTIRRILTTKSPNIVNNHFAYPIGVDYSDIEINLKLIQENSLNEPESPIQMPKREIKQIKMDNPQQEKQKQKQKQQPQKENMVPKKEVKSIDHQPSKHDNEFLEDDVMKDNTIIIEEQKQTPRSQNPWQQNRKQNQITLQQPPMKHQKQIDNQTKDQDLIKPIHHEQQINNLNDDIPKQYLVKKLSKDVKIIKSKQLKQCVDNLDDIIAEINGLPYSSEQFEQQNHSEEQYEYEQSDTIQKNDDLVPITNKTPDTMVELIFDPVFQCYIDMKTGEYFVAKT